MAARNTKRSSKVRLTTMAALSSGAMLTACGGDPAPAAKAADPQDKLDVEIEVYENVFACAKATGKTTKECEEMRAEAQAIAAKDAPRFEAKEDCEAVYGAGNCVQETSEQTSHARSTRIPFTPFLAAWYSSKRDGKTGPLFKSGSNGYQTANGSRVGYGGQPGKYLASARGMERAKSVPKVKAASDMARAAGFGKPGYGKKSGDFGRTKAAGGVMGGSDSGAMRSKGG
ncbi:DUF1190 domain-containing protein [Erythrobacter sp. SCSIO 43205]|uniref:DUF1190 domain-containing protein n=1 Tax=Erythrobacter sp. SCSIO 43205 TaxID=2779361 RepID=UPI001CA836B3|nr:DUF1190 domain-containing protein [Erythrobacter sp. SCSIO 43205]UAB79475.1 DUF1190 domain-containing protein [Erythrobacter sp. SCSIO 43205]